jgi:excisionase family DNA binding protein
MKAGAGQDREPYVDAIQVAEFLGLSVRSVRRMVADSQSFPAFKIGRAVRFRLSEVDRWVRTNRL